MPASTYTRRVCQVPRSLRPACRGDAEGVAESKERVIATVPGDHRVNERIRVDTVRLIDHEGNQRGVVATRDALVMARSLDFDLVEIAPTAVPPVCRIMD